MIDTLLPFWGKQGESITPSEHSLPQAGTDQSGILSDERAAPPALFNQFTAGKSPAAGGAKALTARGGEGASIAKMYILRACRGNPLTPMPPADGKLKQLGADQHEETSTPHKPKIICQRILSVHKKCEKEENISNTQWRKEM